MIGQVLGEDFNSLNLASTIGIELNIRLPVAAKSDSFAFKASAESWQFFGHAVIQMEAVQAIKLDEMIVFRLIVEDGDEALAVPHILPCRKHIHEPIVVVERLHRHFQRVIALDTIEQAIVPFRLELVDFVISDAIKKERIGHHLFHGRNGHHAICDIQDTVFINIGLHLLVAALEAALVDQQGQPAAVFEWETVDVEQEIASFQILFSGMFLVEAKMAAAGVRTGEGHSLEPFF